MNPDPILQELKQFGRLKTWRNPATSEFVLELRMTDRELHLASDRLGVARAVFGRVREGVVEANRARVNPHLARYWFKRRR